ncbi:MAG: signal peptidase II [Bacteriovoracia bacterium]
MKLKYLVLLAVSGAVISLDQMSKLLVIKRLLLHESIPVIDGIFNLTYVHNPGAAFGLLSKMDPSFRVPFFVIVPVIALILIVLFFRKIDDRDTMTALALSLIIGGAIGNLIDRASYGYVVDFFEIYWKEVFRYPAFNVADSAICIGAALLAIETFRKEKQRKNAPGTA